MMADRENPDMVREESDNPDAISSDESVVEFLWGSEAADVSTGQAEATDEGADADKGEDLAGAMARYGSWLSSLDGGS